MADLIKFGGASPRGAAHAEAEEPSLLAAAYERFAEYADSSATREKPRALAIPVGLASRPVAGVAGLLTADNTLSAGHSGPPRDGCLLAALSSARGIYICCLEALVYPI